MKHFFLFLILVVPFCTVASASERSNTVLIRPGEVIYARFTQKGIKLKLVSATKEKNDEAQLVVTMDPADPEKKAGTPFKIVSKFTRDLNYRLEVRDSKNTFALPIVTGRVVAEKMAVDKLPPFVAEVALYGFELEK